VLFVTSGGPPLYGKRARLPGADPQLGEEDRLHPQQDRPAAGPPGPAAGDHLRQRERGAASGRGAAGAPVSARQAKEAREQNDDALWKASGFAAVDDYLLNTLDQEERVG
jgi:hypothetical protein